jgi:hypothetical protein
MRHKFLILTLFAASAVARPALADQYDTLNLVVGTSVIYDSNVFRVPDSLVLPPAVGTDKKSDLIHVTSAALRIDKPYAPQRFPVRFARDTL